MQRLPNGERDRPLASARPSGFVFYDGPSMIDGAPIVAILTGLGAGSHNEKTGALLQTWIVRKDVSPVAAVHTGEDASICGDCKHRGTIENGRNVGRSCYVTVFQAPLNVWKSYHRGIYPTLAVGAARELIVGGKLRGGSYGDPAAVPFYVWDCLYDAVDTGTAYTHQWRRFPELAAWCMASVDTESERVEAKLLGFRTFRVRKASEPKLKGEANCPASAEVGYKATCFDCVACNGHKAKAKCDITIVVHSTAGKVNAFNRMV